MPPNNFSLLGNGNNRRQNNQNNYGNGFNNNQNMNMNFPPNMQQGGQMNQNYNQGYNQNYNRQMQNNQRNYNRQQMQNQQYQNMPPGQFPNQMQQQYPQQNQMMPNQMQNNMPMANGNRQQQQNQMMSNQMQNNMPMANGNRQQQNQMMPNQMYNQQQPAQQMNQIPDLSQLPVYEPLAGQTPVHAQLPAPQSGGPVSYEQLDEKTMAEVQRLINEKRGVEGTPAPAGESNALPSGNLLPVAAVETTFQEKEDKLVEFIQNERNASEFYKYLSEAATKDEYSRTLENISKESMKRSDELNNIYKSMNGRNYDIKKSKVNNSIKFKDGLSWAINVENKSLREISDYYAKMSNDGHSKKINSIIHKKICDLNYLQTMYTNLKAFF